MESVKERSKLLILTSEMNLSWETDLAISELIAHEDITSRERLAADIYNKIKDCKTDDEVIETLGLDC